MMPDAVWIRGTRNVNENVESATQSVLPADARRQGELDAECKLPKITHVDLSDLPHQFDRVLVPVATASPRSLCRQRQRFKMM